MRLLILILLVIPLFSQSEPIKAIPANVAADRPVKSCRQNGLVNRLESIFLRIQRSNRPIFEAARTSRENICLNLGPSSKGRPAAYANSQSGEIVFSDDFLDPNISDEILAGVMAHEIAHILLHHNDTEILPFELRKKLPIYGRNIVERYFSLQDDLINERFYRGSLFDPYSGFDIESLEGEEPEFIALALEVLPSPLFNEEGRFFVEPHLADEARYAKIYDLADQGKVTSDHLRNSLESTRRYHENITSILTRQAEIQKELEAIGVQVKHGLSPRQLSEKEADELGLKLFLNSG